MVFKLIPTTGFTSFVGFNEMNKNIGPNTINNTPKNIEASYILLINLIFYNGLLIPILLFILPLA